MLDVFRDEALSGTELTSKLEQAFLGGLRCSQPAIRHKFVEVFNASIPRRVFDRLLYITCSQNWEAMGAHFWIKQCIEVGSMIGLLSFEGGPSCNGTLLLIGRAGRRHYAILCLCL